jgi:hypothetical protein
MTLKQASIHDFAVLTQNAIDNKAVLLRGGEDER